MNSLPTTDLYNRPAPRAEFFTIYSIALILAFVMTMGTKMYFSEVTFPLHKQCETEKEEVNQQLPVACVNQLLNSDRVRAFLQEFHP